MNDPSTLVILDPEAAEVVRVGGSEFDDLNDRLLLTWTAESVEDLGALEVKIGLLPEKMMSLVVAILNGMGIFSEGDLEYLAERFEKEWR